MYFCMPGQVVSYDSANQVADIQPMTNDVRADISQSSDTGKRVPEPWPVIPSVPIAWPRFGKFVIAGRLNQYDPVMLLAFDLDPTSWRATGSKPSNNPVDPADARRHGGHYWWALPCDLRLNKVQSASAAANGMVIGLDGGQAQIIITDSNIQLGGGGGDFVALASLVKGELDKIAAAFGSFLPGSGGASFAKPYATASPVASSLIKAQ
jgi:hypothetical protein